MGQTEIVVGVEQRQLRLQAVLALAQRVNPPSHCGYPLANIQVQSLDKGRIDSKVAGVRLPEWEYTPKTLENQGLLCMLEGCQTPIDTGANPCGDAHASLATYTTFSIPSSPFSTVRKPG